MTSLWTKIMWHLRQCFELLLQWRFTFWNANNLRRRHSSGNGKRANLHWRLVSNNFQSATISHVIFKQYISLADVHTQLGSDRTMQNHTGIAHVKQNCIELLEINLPMYIRKFEWAVRCRASSIMIYHHPNASVTPKIVIEIRERTPNYFSMIQSSIPELLSDCNAICDYRP